MNQVFVDDFSLFFSNQRMVRYKNCLSAMARILW